MMNWAQANLNKGELNGIRILKPESYEILWNGTVELNNNTIGLSWFLGDYHGIKTISHGGGDLGYRSYITLIPDKKIGIILASNYSLSPIGRIHNGILAILFGYDYEIPRLSISMEITEVYDKQGLDAAKAFYYKQKNENEQKYSFGHWELNRLAYYYLGKEEIQKAIEILEFNVDLYPEVANTYDSLGEAYMGAGEIEKAILNYEKSLSLDPGNKNARDMLNKLKSKN
jgi:tetratricopeptide (TPR) repeat protein